MRSLCKNCNLPEWPHPPFLTNRPDWKATRGGFPRLLSKGQGMDTTLSFGERTYGGIDLGVMRGVPLG